MHPVKKTEFFDGVDGLRAIAVLSVVAFHLNAWLPAGFVGVDVFFVISGFVVFGACSTLDPTRLRDFLLGFYARRVIRIVPALLVCVLVSFGLMVLFVPLGTDGRFSERNTLTALAALVGGANIALSAGAADYWSPRSEFNPFTHTWSLGVEEQFYLLAPFVFLAWYRGRKASAALVLAAMAMASVFVAAAWGTSVKSFYLLPARFWELAAGVALYMCMPWWRGRLLSYRGDVLAACGVVLLGTSFLVTGTGTFPWPGAALPVAAALMLIMAVVARPDGWLNRVLTLRAVQWVGKRSYAIYLWHWPVFVFLRWTVGLESVPVQFGALAATLLLGAASMVWVEQPAKGLLAGRSASRGGGGGRASPGFGRPGRLLHGACDRPRNLVPTTTHAQQDRSAICLELHLRHSRHAPSLLA
ncbi:acyltransferase family protein [Aquabacterium sp. OR-4]|uniref:acyltransferase family protein n=1 Tax=Aquabacterium sp. OR-4 TaxID=2978127 RepID=UPI0028C6E38D|nr:acyltransferase [Aquabacterium sp. OR-4]MDT7835871.1 acyltransferase [Aquabacterium sp. OR-4]